jgi:hypothetical protein
MILSNRLGGGQLFSQWLSPRSALLILSAGDPITAGENISEITVFVTISAWSTVMFAFLAVTEINSVLSIFLPPL